MYRKHIQEKLLSSFNDNQILKQTPRYVRSTFCNQSQNNKTITTKSNCKSRKTFLSVLSKTHSFSKDNSYNNQTHSINVNEENKIKPKNIFKKSNGNIVIGGQPKPSSLKLKNSKKSLRLHSSTVSLTSNCSTKKSLIYNIQDKFSRRKSLSRISSSKATTPVSFTIQDQNHLNLIQRLVQQKINSKISDINNSNLSKSIFKNQVNHEANSNLAQCNKRNNYLNNYNYESRFDFSTPAFKKEKIDSHREKQIQKKQIQKKKQVKIQEKIKKIQQSTIKPKRRASVGQIYSISNKQFGPSKQQVLQQYTLDNQQISKQQFQYKSQNENVQVIISKLPQNSIRYTSQTETIPKSNSEMFSNKPYKFYQQKGLQKLSYSKQLEAEECLEKVEEIKNQISNLQNLISSRIKLAQQRSKSLTISRVTQKFQVYDSTNFNTIKQQFSNDMQKYSRSRTLKKQQHQHQSTHHMIKSQIPLRGSLVQYRKYECPTQDIKSQLIQKINNHKNLNETKINKQPTKSSILNKQNNVCSSILQKKLENQSNQISNNYQRSFGNLVNTTNFRVYH